MNDEIKPTHYSNWTNVPLKYQGEAARCWRKIFKSQKNMCRHTKKRRLLPERNGWPPLHVNKWYGINEYWQDRFGKIMMLIRPYETVREA